MARSAAFYAAVFGWVVDLEAGGFEAPGLVGRWSTERRPAADGAGPRLWLATDDLGRAMHAATGAGGVVVAPPRLDGGRRWLVELDDPAGNCIGIVAAARPPRPQVLLAVRDVEASSRWYRELLGLRSDHGGPQYERLLAGDELVLQLHHHEVAHEHGRFHHEGVPVGNGVLVWFGEVADFDAVAARAEALAAPVVLASHRNPPVGEGNGPAHRELWIRDPDGYTVVVASPDGEAWEQP